MILELRCGKCSKIHGTMSWEPSFRKALKLKSRKDLFFGTVYTADVRCGGCGKPRKVSKEKLFRGKASAIVRAVERRGGKKIEILMDRDGSGWVKDTFRLYLGSRTRGASFDKTWDHRIPYHELGHAVFDIFPDCFDKQEFKALFMGSLRERYTYDIADKLRQQGVRMILRKSLTIYGKTHQQEAWADAFSFALSGATYAGKSEIILGQIIFAKNVIAKVLAQKEA